MNNLQQEFLNEAVSSLENLHSKLLTKPPDEEFLREIFRAFHTLKGTAQTFNFNASGKLAHELESLLEAVQNRQIQPDKKFVSLLSEGMKILREGFRRALEGKEIYFPSDFAEKLRAFIPDSFKLNADFSLNDIPPDVLESLSVEERKTLSAAMANGKKFYSIEVGFDLSDFAEKFRALRDALQNQCEIIATFPHAALSGENKIGFLVFFVSRKNRNELTEIAKLFDANLTDFDSTVNFTSDLQGVLAQAVSVGEKNARRLGKKVEFETEAAEFKISGKLLKLLSGVLPHLVRNAADHAIETSGKIKIEFLSEKDDLILLVSDDGRGLDAEKIRAKAIDKKLIAANENLSRAETFDLIFAHGFSTAESVSEISGRGVGLDAVKDMIEKAGGGIRVESEAGKGTLFEIHLPK